MADHFDMMILIKTQLDNLPRWCKGLEDDHESHEWVHAYERYQADNWFPKFDGPTYMLPYYTCRHCHAVSTNFTDSTTIKRAR